MIDCEDIYPEILDEILNYLANGKMIELLFVDNDEMRSINNNERNIDKTTDVLSFPYINTPKSNSNFPIGSIVINLDLAKTKADEFAHNIDDEIALLFTHGILHILGFDHENDSGEMRDKEEQILKHFNLPKSLIIRTES